MSKRIFAIAVVSVIMIASLGATALAGKPEEPNPFQALWDAITGIQAQAEGLQADVTGLLSNDTDLQEQIDDVAGGLAPDYDSGWIDIRDMAGREITISHGLNTTDVRVYLAGKTTADGGAHQRYLGLVNPVEAYERACGGSSLERGHSMIQTSDGGYAIAAKAIDHDNEIVAAWLIKAAASGTVEWDRTYYGTYGYTDVYSIVQTSDGGYTLGSNNWFSGTLLDVWLISFDPNGESGLAWTGSTADAITLYRGFEDTYWNYVRVQIWTMG